MGNVLTTCYSCLLRLIWATWWIWVHTLLLSLFGSPPTWEKNITIFSSNKLQLVTYFICHLLLGRFHRVSLSEPLSTENNNLMRAVKMNYNIKAVRQKKTKTNKQTTEWKMLTLHRAEGKCTSDDNCFGGFTSQNNLSSWYYKKYWSVNLWRWNESC